MRWREAVTTAETDVLSISSTICQTHRAPGLRRTQEATAATHRRAHEIWGGLRSGWGTFALWQSTALSYARALVCTAKDDRLDVAAEGVRQWTVQGNRRT